MTKTIKKSYNKPLKNLNYPKHLPDNKSKFRQIKHINLKIIKPDLKKKKVIKINVKKFIRSRIYKRRIKNIDIDNYYVDKVGNIKFKKKHRTWKDRYKYASMNKQRFWSYAKKPLWKQKRQNFQKHRYLNKKRYHQNNKVSTKWLLNKHLTKVVYNFNQTSNFSKKLQILTKNIYYSPKSKKKDYEILFHKKMPKKKRFLAQFLPYKWRLIKWKLKRSQISNKNLIRPWNLYNRIGLNKFKRKRHKLNRRVKQLRKLLQIRRKCYKFRKQIIRKELNVFSVIKIVGRIKGFRPKSTLFANVKKIFSRFLLLKLVKNIRKLSRNTYTTLFFKNLRSNNFKFKLINLLRYQNRLHLSMPKLRKLNFFKTKEKLEKLLYKNKKKYKKSSPKKLYGFRQPSLRNTFRKNYIKNKNKKIKASWRPGYFFRKNKREREDRHRYNRLASNYGFTVNINKRKLIRLESPFFKKDKFYKKIEYLTTPKKYKNIFKNFYFQNTKWNKSLLLNRKFRKDEILNKKSAWNEFNWKKTREEPWHQKRVKWLSKVLDKKSNTSPFFIGTFSWNNRWHFYYKKNILQRINKNKQIPIQPYIETLRPFVRYRIFKQKHLPTNYINKDAWMYLFLRYADKIHWTDYDIDDNFFGIANWDKEESTVFPIKALDHNDENPFIIFEESHTFLNNLLHDTKKSSFILYKNWPRQIFQHTILLKNIHKRMKLINNYVTKEDLDYKNPQPRFDKFHKLFSIDWRTKKAAPWFEPLFFPRITHPIQYFNFWYSKKSIYIRKRSKIYRKFSKEAFNLYEPLKYRSSRRGGHRNFNWNRILSKVFLPFFGKTFSQFQASFNEVRLKKSKQISRTEALIKNLNSQLYRVVYNFNAAPSIFWARRILQIGWIYISHLQVNNNTRMFFNSLSIDKLFPLIFLNKNYTYISSKSDKFTQTSFLQESNKVDNGAVVSISPVMKLLIKEFFSRRLNWDRHVTPSYGNLNRRKNTIVISQSRYRDNFSEYTKDRSNTKRFPFFYN